MHSFHSLGSRCAGALRMLSGEVRSSARSTSAPRANKRFHLLVAVDHLAARQQQRVVGVADVERQRLSHRDAVPDGGER